jgi:hypothetical protein
VFPLNNRRLEGGGNQYAFPILKVDLRVVYGIGRKVSHPFYAHLIKMPISVRHSFVPPELNYKHQPARKTYGQLAVCSLPYSILKLPKTKVDNLSLNTSY